MKSYQNFCVGNRLIGGYCIKTLFAAGLALLLIWGCEGGSKPAKPPVVRRQRRETPPAQKKEEKVAEKVADEKTEPPYTYNPVGKRDPFKPFITLGSSRKPPATARLTPLQRYDVSELRLVGILKGPAGYRALVEDASGKGFIITRGTLIGRENGRVKEIHDDRVIIKQTHKDIFGEIKEREISIRLKKPEEGGVR